MAGMTDKERLDYLDALTGSYSDRVTLRFSTTGRGWRLHETRAEHPNFPNVREAIDHHRLAHIDELRVRADDDLTDVELKPGRIIIVEKREPLDPPQASPFARISAFARGLDEGDDDGELSVLVVSVAVVVASVVVVAVMVSL